MKRLAFARVIFNYNSTIRSLVLAEDLMKLHNIANRLADQNTTTRLSRGTTKRCFLGKSYSIGILTSKKTFTHVISCTGEYVSELNTG